MFVVVSAALQATTPWVVHEDAIAHGGNFLLQVCTLALLFRLHAAQSTTSESVRRMKAPLELTTQSFSP